VVTQAKLPGLFPDAQGQLEKAPAPSLGTLAVIISK